MKKLYWLLGLLLVIIAGYFYVYEMGSKDESPELSVLPERIELQFGNAGLETIAKYKGRMQKHGSGIGFSDISWRYPNLGKVKIYSSESDLEIDHLTWLQGYSFYKGFGLQSVSIFSSFHSEEYVTEQEAYQGYVALMQQLQDKGWHQFFLPFTARFHPEYNFKYIAQRQTIINPSYIFTFSEWESMMSKTKYLYLDLQNGDLRLDIRIYKEGISPKKVKYNVDYSFETKQFYNMNMISDYDDLNLDEKRKSFVANQEEAEEIRKLEEKKAVLEGYQIDESYIDDIYDYKPY